MEQSDHARRLGGDEECRDRRSSGGLGSSKTLILEHCARKDLQSILRRRIGQGFALVGPFLELDEAPRGVAVGVERRIRRISSPCARDRATRRRPAALPSEARPGCFAAAFEWSPHVLKRVLRAFGIMREIPRRSQGDETLDGDDIGRRDRHRSAKAIADQRCRLVQCCAARAAAIPRHGRRR